MVKHTEPDQSLIKLPSLRAVRTFVAAAKYQNFTRAAEALCVTQAAVSRQIRELEEYMGSALFRRSGRNIELTAAGSSFYDAVQFSFANISQAVERIRDQHVSRPVVTLCCTPAFSNLWLTPRLPDFFARYPGIDLNLITTQKFLDMEPGVKPDIFITKRNMVDEGLRSQPLVCDVIYPVCTPQYLKLHPQVRTLEGLRDSALLNLGPYGRSQVAEHVDWGLWLAFHDIDFKDRTDNAGHFFSANDYNTLIQLALNHQGVVLGWHYLVAPLVEQGLLVRPVKQQMVQGDTQHYLSLRLDKEDDPGCRQLHDWLLEQFALHNASS